jgi:predicted GNAT superfamily acetyltransferase
MTSVAVLIRDATAGDYPSICALNLAEVHHTSDMDVERLAELSDLACYHKVALVNHVVAAFLLAMRHDSPYKNVNFAWFAGRYDQFLYIDRIVVSSACRGMRLGSLLYEDLFGFAKRECIPLLACEYNIFPLNEASRSFHDKFGFEEQGTQWVGQRKQVSLQVARAFPGASPTPS